MRDYESTLSEADFFHYLETTEAIVADVHEHLIEKGIVAPMFIELSWRRWQCGLERTSDVLDFLSSALQSTEPGIWKKSLDGLATVPGGIEILKSFYASRVNSAERLKLEWIADALDGYS
jgi:hypothetical protein